MGEKMSVSTVQADHDVIIEHGRKSLETSLEAFKAAKALSTNIVLTSIQSCRNCAISIEALEIIYIKIDLPRSEFTELIVYRIVGTKVTGYAGMWGEHYVSLDSEQVLKDILEKEGLDEPAISSTECMQVLGDTIEKIADLAMILM
jgi:hypothetical protein